MKEKKKIMGRPKKKIKWKDFVGLCKLQATEVEIASWFEVSVDTIERRCKEKYKKTFAEIYKEKSKAGLISIRREMLKIALSGNVTMLIWLSKNYLDFSDKREETILEKSFDVKYTHEEEE